MTRGQKVIIIILAIWWLLVGIATALMAMDSYSSSWNILGGFILAGLVLTIPMGLIWYMLKPKK